MFVRIMHSAESQYTLQGQDLMFEPVADLDAAKTRITELLAINHAVPADWEADDLAAAQAGVATLTVDGPRLRIKGTDPNNVGYLYIYSYGVTSTES